MTSREVPAYMRNLAPDRIAVRLTRTACDAVCLTEYTPGWRSWSRRYAQEVLDWCRAHCGPTPRAERQNCPYTRGEKTAMRKLAEQLESKL